MLGAVAGGRAQRPRVAADARRRRPAGRARPRARRSTAPCVLAGFLLIVASVVLLVDAGRGGGQPARAPRGGRRDVARCRHARCGRCGERASRRRRPSASAMALEPRGGTAWAVRSALPRRHLRRRWASSPSSCSWPASTSSSSTPARYGSPFDALVSGFSGNPLEEGDGELLDDPRVDGGRARVRRARHASAARRSTPYAFESLKGDMAPHHPRRAPARPDGAEVALGTSTLDAAGAGVGDEVEIEGAAGTLRATVVGTAVFPVVDERSAPGRGVLLGPRGPRADLRPRRDQRRRLDRLGRRRRRGGGQRRARRGHGDGGVRARASRRT